MCLLQGGRRRRWCVLRTYAQNEASIDIYLDESKTRYKGTVSLDKEQAPILIVKNADSKRRKTMKQCYLSLKVGKNSYHFTTDSFRELKEWCALIRQAMDNGKYLQLYAVNVNAIATPLIVILFCCNLHVSNFTTSGNTFSGRVTEPNNIEEGALNVKFNSNCIALLCPIKEVPLKTWRLDCVTSFGQCGGIFMFESCATCSDSGAAKCSINIIQEKPSTILNILERAIRNNPNTGEVHLERSILGDVYHCDHDCSRPRFLVPAYSDPNLFRSASVSPQKGLVVPVHIHDHLETVPSSTLDSSDSGLPGTPQHPDTLSVSSSIPSPTGSNKSTPSLKTKEKTSPHRLRSHSNQMKENRNISDTRPPPIFGEGRVRRQSEPQQFHQRVSDETQNMSENLAQHHHPRLMYAMINHETTPKLVRKDNPTSPVPYATVQTSNRFFSDTTPPVKERYNRLQPLDEPDYDNQVIYDEPNCEPCDTPFSPSSWSAHESRKNSASSGVGANSCKSPIHSCASQSNYRPGSDVEEREEDFVEIPPQIPKHRRRPPVKELVKLNDGVLVEKPRPLRTRLHSTSELLDSPQPKNNFHTPHKIRGSMDDLARRRSKSVATGSERQLKGSTDLLARLHEEDEMLNKVLNASKKQRNEELLEARDRVGELNRPFKFSMDELEYDEPDPDAVFETCSNLAEYQRHVYSSPSHIDKVLTKVTSDSVRGYAYKIAIPLANTQYDVPRTKAPVPDLSKVRHDAPPKPVRHKSTDQFY